MTLQPLSFFFFNKMSFFSGKGNYFFVSRQRRKASPQVFLDLWGTIVTKPDITGPEEAALFMQTMQEILRYVKVTKGNLEEGNMRCDANINLNVWENGTLYHTPISEIKNLNSFRAIKDDRDRKSVV